MIPLCIIFAVVGLWGLAVTIDETHSRRERDRGAIICVVFFFLAFCCGYAGLI